MKRKELKEMRKAFTQRNLQTPEIYMRRWDNNELQDTLENNMIALEATSLELMCNGSGAGILCKAREHTEHCIDIKDRAIWSYLTDG
jgi:hypothetical protein